MVPCGRWEQGWCRHWHRGAVAIAVVRALGNGTRFSPRNAASRPHPAQAGWPGPRPTQVRLWGCPSQASALPKRHPGQCLPGLTWKPSESLLLGWWVGPSPWASETPERQAPRLPGKARCALVFVKPLPLAPCSMVQEQGRAGTAVAQWRRAGCGGLRPWRGLGVCRPTAGVPGPLRWPLLGSWGGGRKWTEPTWRARGAGWGALGAGRGWLWDSAHTPFQSPRSGAFRVPCRQLPFLEGLLHENRPRAPGSQQVLYDPRSRE